MKGRLYIILIKLIIIYCMGTKLLHVYRKLLHVHKELGLINLLFYAMDRFLSLLPNNNFRIYKYLLVIQAVKAKPILPPHRAKNIRIRPIFQHEAHQISFPRPNKVIDFRFQQNAHCLAAFVDDKLAGFIWLNFGNYSEDEVRCTFSPQPASKIGWDYDVYIDPKHRNGLTFVKLWDSANQFMRENNILHTMSRISAFNSQSMASHKRMGAKKLGSTIFVCLGKIQILLATVAPYVYVSINERQFPTIVLRNDSSQGKKPA